MDGTTTNTMFQVSQNKKKKIKYLNIKLYTRLLK